MQETIKPVAPRILWADFIRSLGILLVILGHVSGIAVQRFQSVALNDWQAGNIYNVIARSCVPLLFMVSGALLLPKQENLTDFYRKRFNKVIFPFLFWSIMYLLWKEGCFNFTGEYHCYSSYSPFVVVKIWVLSILTTPAEYHLWFMYELFAAYMLTPVLRILATDENRKYLWYLLAIWFVFGPAQRFFEQRFQMQLIFDLGYLTGYIGYFIFGYLITQIRITKPLALAAALVYMATAWFTGNITSQFTGLVGRLVDNFQNLLSWNVSLMATSLFILLKAAAEKIFSTPKPVITKVIGHLSAVSYGMYLIHVFIIAFLKSVHIYPIDEGPSIYMIPVTTLCVFFISWAIIAVLIKIPYVRSLVA